MNTRRHGFAIIRAMKRARLLALSVAKPVFAYICGNSIEIKT